MATTSKTSTPKPILNAEKRTYTAQEERKWNKLSTTMSQFHEYFKSEFNTIYQLADGSFGKRGMSLSMYLNKTTGLIDYLTAHHTFEEANIFPILAKRMPSFDMHKPSKRSSGEDEAEVGAHWRSHQGIHKGLDELSTFVKKFKSAPSSYSPTEMRACMDGFRDVLFVHLDQEVADLRGENMKKYWTLKEMDRLQL